jgi:cell division protein FtsB
MGFCFDIFYFTRFFTKEWRYRVLLYASGALFLTVSAAGSIAVYRAYCQCKTIERREQEQWEHYQRMKNKFEIQQEHARELTENLDFIEHVAREHMQVAGENEVLFRFE